MIWHDIRDADDSELDRLAERYQLHPLHIEDCRHRRQRAKVEDGATYLFVVLKPVELQTEVTDLLISELDIFLGPDFLITVTEEVCPRLFERFDVLKQRSAGERPDQLFYRIVDGLVDSYLPILDNYDDQIDEIEDGVLQNPSPEMLQRILAGKRGLIELRRILSNTRDVAGHIQRIESNLIGRDLAPFLRDVYDHLARNMDLLEMQRDLLTGSLDIYLSSIANRTNQVMKVLTVLGTIALPSIVISGFFGMNTKDLPFLQTPNGTWYPLGFMVVSTALLLFVLKKTGSS